MLTMLDEYTRQCLAIRVERQIKSGQVLATLWQAMMIYGIPEHNRSDNGAEFIASKIQRWLRENQIKTFTSWWAALGKTATLRVSTAIAATIV